MKIAVIGAGFAGLTAALEISKNGRQVSIFEKEDLPGGLSLGFKKENWDWFLEKHYHHLFTSDKYIKDLAKNLDIEIEFKRVKTKSLIGDKIYSLDSAMDVLGFKMLSFLERLRMGSALAFLKASPYLNFMEEQAASFILPKIMGQKSYDLIWGPLLEAKFNSYEDTVPLSWFWARIKKRSSKLGYPTGGFQNLADKLLEEIKKGGKVYMRTPVLEIKKKNSKIVVKINNPENNNPEELEFDKVVFTSSFSLLTKITPELPKDFVKNLSNFKTLSAINLVLTLKDEFFKDNTYWLSICNNNFPFLAVVEHTKFISHKHYNNSHLLYIGSYLPHGHPFTKMDRRELFKIYIPYLKKINPSFESSIIDIDLFNDFDAQPIITLNYSKKIIPFETPIKNLYIANMQQIYPWDRGTNYAVEIGKKIAEFVERK